MTFDLWVNDLQYGKPQSLSSAQSYPRRSEWTACCRWMWWVGASWCHRSDPDLEPSHHARRKAQCGHKRTPSGPPCRSHWRPGDKTKRWVSIFLYKCIRSNFFVKITEHHLDSVIFRKNFFLLLSRNRDISVIFNWPHFLFSKYCSPLSVSDTADKNVANNRRGSHTS